MRYRYGIGILAALLYNIWIGENLLNHQLDPATVLVSEYANPMEPFSWIYRVGDIGAGILLTFIFLSFIFTKRQPKKVFRPSFYFLYVLCMVGWVSFALSTIGDMVFPLDCVCEGSVIFTGKCLTVNNVIHEITSSLAGISAIIMIISGFLSMASLRNKEKTSWRCQISLLFIWGITHLVSAIYAFLSVLMPLMYPGYLQRISILTLSLWWVTYIWVWQSLKSR